MEGLSLKSFIAAIDFKDPTLYLAMLHIMFNPFFWNIIGRIEYNTRFFTKLFGGNRRGCYVAFVFIFSFGISRNLLYKFVVDKQEKLVLENQYIDILGYVLYFFGIVLVVASSLQLGIIGTYLGDYFGILFPSKITGFPYNITNSPMYDGSTLNFLAHSILYRSPAGLLLTFVVYIVYKVGLSFEDPFTEMIYAKAAEEKKSGKTASRKKVE